MFLRSSIFFLVLTASSMVAMGQRRGSQVLDDSTRNVYGPSSTKWITEEDLFFGRNTYQPIDTTILNYHRWTYTQRFNNAYKDLGNIGTALHPVFPMVSNTIGVSTGFTSYDPYFETEEPKYFDTKSPYTRMRIIWGGDGRAMTRVEFSRNISPRWNFGFNYRPILVDRQIQHVKNEKQTTSHYYDGYMAYRGKNDRYQLLLNYRRIRHSVNEIGGIATVDPPGDSTYLSLFDKDVSPLLSKANSVFLQNQAHLFHQYKIGNALQLYHKSDVGKKINLYKDDLNEDPEEYYDNLINPDTLNLKIINDSTRFSYFTNEAGIKGKVGKVFYNGYVKSRSYKFRYKYITEDTLDLPLTDDEYYLGGRLSYEHDSVTHLTTWFEYLDGGNYGAEIKLQSKWVDARVMQTVSKPPFIYNAYRGSFDLWNNKFRNTTTTQAQAFGKLPLGRLSLSAGVKYTAYLDYIYFKRGSSDTTSQTVLPVQSSGKQELLSPELRGDFRFLRNIHLRPQIIYSTLMTNDDDAIRVPELFVNTQVSYENQVFKKNLDMQVGVDIHWKSRYFDLGYDPAIQQYFVQDRVASRPFPLVDIFLNGKMKRGRFFLKYNNFIQAFTKSGYLSTPVYPGQRNILDFGFELLLFD